MFIKHKYRLIKENNPQIPPTDYFDNYITDRYNK